MPIPIALAGAAISSGGSLLGNALGNRGNRKAEKNARKYNLQQWHRQNAYNDPSAQMTRLKKAGLNPNLVYGGSPGQTSGSASPVPQGKAPDYTIDNPIGEMAQYANIKNTEAQTDNAIEQSHVITADADLRRAQTIDTINKGAKSGLDFQIADELKKSTLDGQREQNRQSGLKNIGIESDNRVKIAAEPHKLNKIKEEIKLLQKQKDGQSKTNRLRQLQINLKKLGIEPGDPWYFRAFGQNSKEIFDAINDTKQFKR